MTTAQNRPAVQFDGLFIIGDGWTAFLLDGAARAVGGSAFGVVARGDGLATIPPTAGTKRKIVGGVFANLLY